MSARSVCSCQHHSLHTFSFPTTHLNSVLNNVKSTNWNSSLHLPAFRWKYLAGINYTSFHRSDVLTHVHVCQYKFLSMVLTRRQREFRKERCERRKTVTVENVKYPILPSRRRLFDTLSQSPLCLNKWYVKRRSFRRLIIYEATRATISEHVSFNLSIPPAPSAPACKATVPLDWLWRLTNYLVSNLRASLSPMPEDISVWSSHVSNCTCFVNSFSAPSSAFCRRNGFCCRQSRREKTSSTQIIIGVPLHSIDYTHLKRQQQWKSTPLRSFLSSPLS